MISARTKPALAAAKARGVKHGGDRGNIHDIAAKGREASRAAHADAKAADLSTTIEQIKAEGDSLSLCQLAAALNVRNIPTPRRGA